MARNTVTVLGINGHVGHHAAKAFAAAGWQVTGMGRTNRNPLPGVRFIKGDAADKAQLREAIGDSEVVVNALNLPYDKWDRGRMEALYADVLEVILWSNHAVPETSTTSIPATQFSHPELEQRPSTPRGAIRQRVEAMFDGGAEGRPAGHHPPRRRLLWAGVVRRLVRPGHPARSQEGKGRHARYPGRRPCLGLPP